MQVLDLDNQWTVLTAFEAHLPERIKGLCPDRFWRQHGDGLCPLFLTE
jgi:hypothetical protein